MSGPSRATLAAFARLCLAEADHGEMVRVHDHGLGLPIVDYGSTEDASKASETRPLYLRRLAMLVDRPTWLHLRACTNEEIEELLRLRGMPELGTYVVRIIAPGNPSTRQWCGLSRGVAGQDIGRAPVDSRSARPGTH